MRSNKKVQEIYKIHTQHISRDVKHLGEAENEQDILNIVKEIKPNVYMLSSCCVDGEPTLQIANYQKVRRIRLNLFSSVERKSIINQLENNGIEYRMTSYLPLNRDFIETLRCKIQKCLPYWVLNIWFKLKIFKEKIN